jgi:N-acetylmuramoyl-L-alanine amidase
MSKKVALMCGHGKSKNGSWDTGTTYKGYTEAGLMLPITKAAVKYLRKWGVKVISDADTNNNKNMLVDVAWANKQKCDIYVSIHCDYYKAPAGVMPLYVSAKGKKLASCLNSTIKKGMPMKSRGVVRRTDLWELNGTDMPACILETGCISKDLGHLKAYDKYGKLIAKGICKYLGVEIPKKTETKKEEPKKEETKKEEPKKEEPKKTEHDKLIDKEMKACKAQSDWMKKSKYKFQEHPTIAKSKKMGTCVTYVACVLQRIGILKSGQYIWQNGNGYGTGKVYGDNNKMVVTYMKNKSLKSLKDKLKKGDIILLDDNKSGRKGNGGHIFILTGKWTKNGNPYIWDNVTAQRGKQKAYAYNGNRKVLARIRLK